MSLITEGAKRPRTILYERRARDLRMVSTIAIRRDTCFHLTVSNEFFNKKNRDNSTITL